MQTTNRQRLITFTLKASFENNVLGTVDVDNAAGMPINGGRRIHADVVCGSACTFRLYEKATEDSGFTLLATYFAPAGASAIDFPSAGTTDALSGFAVQLTADPGVATPDVLVAALITA